MPRRPRENKENNDMHQDAAWDQAWNEPHRLDAAKKQVLLESLHQRMHQQRRRKQLFFIGASAAAAAVLIAFFVRVTDLNKEIAVSKWQEMASNDEPRKIVLDDSSVLWLAPHSTLKVHPGFSKQRSTILTKGSAFFAVAKDEKHSFSIHVNQQQVTVLGTSFTIHKLDSVDIQLNVKEGKVALNNAGGRQLVVGGQQVHTSREMTGKVQPGDPAAADWWLQKQVRWHNITLGELLTHIENYYQKKLSYGDIDKKMTVTLTWDMTLSLNDNLAVLNSLTGYNIH